MKNRLIALAFAAAVVFAIPVAASATEGDDAAPEHPPVDLEARFDTFSEAVEEVTERMTRALERLSDRRDLAQASTEAPGDLLERLDARIGQLEETLGDVAQAEDFDDLNSILEDAREQRREMRGDRPHRPRRCGPHSDVGDGAEGSTS